MDGSNKLIWKPEYSVNVKEIDDQHKFLFAIINDLIMVIHSVPDEKDVERIMRDIVKYKTEHFATEEKYFHQFNFAGTADHEREHRIFSEKLKEIQDKYQDDTIRQAFALVDFLEDWFVMHLMNTDQEYKECFNEHGLL